MKKFLRKRKGVFALLLALFLGMGTAYAYDFSATCPSGQTLYYNIIDATNHYVEITHPATSWISDVWEGFTKPTGNITLSSSVTYNNETYIVTKIGPTTFFRCSGLTGSLTIPNSVTEIGANAFAECSGFTGSLTIGNSVTTIGGGAFAWCPNFTGTLTLGSSLITIEDQAFYLDSGFTGSLTIPNSVTTIGELAFADCGFTGSLTLSNSLTTIGEMAFHSCHGFTGSLTIPNSVTTLAEWAFYFCDGFTGSLTLPNSVTTIGFMTFGDCSGFTGTLTIPDAVTSIGTQAFVGCGGFTDLIIGASVTSIGDRAFQSCWNLSSMMVYPETPPTLGTNAFYNVPKAIPVRVPCNKLTTYQNASGWNEFTSMQEYCDPLTYSINPDGVSVTVTGHVDGTSATGELFIPESKVINGVSYTVTAIGDSAFDGCQGLTGSLTIPNTVTSIGNWSFCNCHGFIGSLTIPDAVTSIGTGAFYYCTGFNETLTIGTGVTSIGLSAFAGCLNFTQVNYNAVNCADITNSDSTPFKLCGGTLTIGNTVQRIPAYMFYDADNLTGLTLSNSVTTIGACAFGSCNGLTGSLTIPNSVTEIEYGAFGWCSNFNGTLTLGSSLTTIGAQAFYADSGFTGSLTIPNSVTTIGNFAFKNCFGFNGTLTVGTAVTSLGMGAFVSCGNFTQVKYNAINCADVESTTKPFENCTGTLTIGNAVQRIPEYMFYECTSLSGPLTIGNSVTSIGFGAFQGCSGFTGSLTLPNSVITIENYAFHNCTGFEGTLTLPNSVTSIGWSAFCHCRFTGSLILPTSLTTIRGYTFYDCRFTGSLVIPNSVTTIEYCAFFDCHFDGSLTLPNALITIEDVAFAGCDFTGSLTIPNSVTTIGYEAFRWCSGISNLTIGASVTSIDHDAFGGCTGLTSMMIYPETPPTLGSNAFQDVPTNIPVKVPCNTLSTYQNASGWNAFANNMQEYCDPLTYSINPDGVSVTVTGHVDGSSATGELFIPETKVIDGVSYTVTAIGNYAFNLCTGLTGDLIIPNTVTSIGRYAFQLCSGFTSLTLSNSLTTLEGAFYLCSGMTGNLTLPNSLTEIGRDSFGSCSFTGSLSIPNSVTVIGDGAFWGCTGFTGSLTIPNSVTTIGNNAFKYCPGFGGTLTIGTGVTSIGDAAFDLCTGITHINYNAVNCENVSFTDGNKPFEGFQGTLTIGSNVQRIPAFLFYSCYGLTGSLTIPSSVTIIEGYAFYFCSGLTGPLAIPNSVTEINHAAFAGCTGFTSLTLGNSLTKLDTYAFSDCTGLEGSLTLPNSLTTINKWAFENCTGLTGTLTIPNSVTSIGKGAFRNCIGFTQVQFNAINCADFPSTDNDETPFQNIMGTLNFGYNVQRIPAYMFSDCIGLTGWLDIPNSVTEIGRCAFYNCHGFDHLSLGNSLISIGVYAFEDCSGLTGTLTIPESVTTIETYAFVGCNGFTSLTIGSSVNWMSFGAFYNCTGLTSITVHPETPPTLGNHLGNNVFQNVPTTIPVYVPCGSISDYQAASGWSDFTNYQCLPWTVTLTANPYDGGDAVFMVGDGTYANGASCTVQATPNANYQFMHWNKNGTLASSNASYTFNVYENTELEAVFMPLANAGTIIGGGENTSVFLPSYSYYKYELSQQIYTASELGGSFTINSISFFNAGNEETRSYDVYLVHTNKSSFTGNSDWIVAAEANRVFRGNVTMRTGMWTTIVLNTPFTYNGTSNLALIVDDNTNDFTESPHMACRVYNAPQSYQAIYVRSDNTNYDPTNPSSYTGSRLSVKNQIMFNRPVYTITATANNSSMGTVTGAGQYGYGDLCRLTATANSGHTFLDWMRTDGVAVTDEAEYEFIVTGNRTLWANFFAGTDVCNLTFNLDNYDQGWGSHYLEVHFGNGMSHLFGVLNDEATASYTLPFVNGNQVKLNMQNVTFSDQCPFEVRYANGNLVCSSAVLVGESSYKFDMDCEEMPASWVYLGDGDDIASEYLPSHSYYNYGLSQQIYTAAEIGNSGIITSIAFYNQGEDNTKTRTYDIYLKPTSKMEFVNGYDWVSVSEEDKVFSGTVTMTSNEWTVITFDKPFDYDGTSNLVLVMDDNSGNWTNAPHLTCRVYYSGLDQAIYMYADYANFDPSNLSAYNGTLMEYKEKNQVYFGFTSSLDCWAPGFMASTDITSNSATLNWEGYQDSYNVRYRVAPLFYEDFEDEETFAADWTFISMNSSNDIGAGTFAAGLDNYAAYSGDYGFKFSSYNTASDYNQYLVSPQLTVTGELKFYAMKYNDYDEYLYVGYSTTTDDLDAFIWSDDLGLTTNWVEYTQELPDDVKYIAFHYYGDYLYYVYLDDITIGIQGIPTGGWITVNNVVGTTTEITGLDPQTNYLWQVQGNNASCGEEGHTQWSEKATFTTKCEAILVDADNPFFEGFEGETFAPDCWEIFSTGSSNWISVTYSPYAHSGSACAYSNYYGDNYLVLPDIELSADASTAQLTFWSYNIYLDDFEVGNNNVVLLNGNTETVLWSAETVSAEWEETTIDLTAYVGQTISLAFKYAGNDGNGWRVDDVEVSAFTCSTPFDVYVTDITTNEATVHWVSEDDTWIVWYGASYNETYGFETNTLEGWTSQGSSIWIVDTGDAYSAGAHSGNYNAMITHSSSGNVTWLISPMIDMTGVNMSYVDFWYINRNWAGDVDGLGVYYRIDGGEWHELWTTDQAHETWTEQRVGLYYLGNNFQIGFKMTDGYGYGVGLDDIEIFTAEFAGSSWAYYPDQSFTFTGLEPNTTYYYYMISNCSGIDSNSTDMIYFTTEGESMVTQTIELVEGWNWISSYIEGDPIELLQALETALGENATQIKSADSYTDYYDGYGWYGPLDETGMYTRQMYMVMTNTACSVTLEGPTVNPADVDININLGWNWIGYPVDHNMTPDAAFTNFTPADLDVIKGGDDFWTYYEGFGWYSETAEYMKPGQGYMYYSNSATSKTLIYSSGTK